MLAIVFSGAACSHRVSDYASATPHVLRLADESDPSSLNPLLAHDQVTIGFDLLFVQTLVGLSRENRLIPILVTRVPTRANGDISPDGRTIVYHLRRGVRFADGQPLTSRDVAFTFRAILDPRNPVLGQVAYRHIVSLTTPNSAMVVVRLRDPWNAAVRELFAESDYAFGILPAHAFASTALQGAPWEEHAFGTGPFRVTAWRRGDRISLEPNPYFSPRPRLARIDLLMIPDFDAAMLAVRTGEVDVARVLAVQAANAASQPGLRIVATPINGFTYLALQSAAAPTDDVRVRRAIAEALDVPEIEKAFRGLYPRAAAFLPPVLAWHDANLVPIAHDEAAASADLDAAGWHLERGVRVKNGTPLRLLFVMASGGASHFESIVQRQLAEVGIEVTIKGFPVTEFYAPAGPIRSSRFNIAAQPWIGGGDPEQSVVFACSQIGPDGDNVARFCDRRFDAAYEDQATTPKERRRAADFMTMQRIVFDRLPVIPLNYPRYFDLSGPRVRGFGRNMLAFPVDAETWDTQ